MEPLEVEKRILGEVYSSAEPMENLTVLCDDFGGRFAGTPENRRAAEFILGKFEEYGLENPRLEAFTFPGCEVISSKLSVVEPVEREVPCIALPMTVSGEVEDELVFLADGPSLEEQEAALEGKVVMALSRGPMYRSILAGAEGFILMHPHPAMGPPTGHIPSVIPSVGVSYEDGSYLSRLLERKAGVRVRIETECRHLERETWNVVAEVPGAGDTDEFILFGAHYDGHEIAQAAFDDGAACAAVMEIGRVLNKVRAHLRRSIRVACFSAEEFGAHGSRDYASRHAEEMGDMLFTFQLDMCGGGSTQMVTVDFWPELEPFFEGIAADLRVEMPIEQRRGPGDSRVFFELGIPTGNIRDYAYKDDILLAYRHTMFDTLDKIDLRSLRECIAIGAVSGFRMANAEEWPGHRSAEEVEKLNAPGLEALEMRRKLRDYLTAKREELRPEAKLFLERLHDLGR
ncbi:MAG: M28 family peptidase [Candidatus Bathyarchaeia archaeon]